jgi:uncharacterized protein with PIN domain
MTTRTPKLKHITITRLARLLDMLYRPAELAQEIGVSPTTIYTIYLPAGLPHRRDENGNIWIHGTAFIAWARQTILNRRSQRIHMPPDHAWCVRCNAPSPMTAPTVRPFNRYVELLQDRCPVCGSIINRARSITKIMDNNDD